MARVGGSPPCGRRRGLPTLRQVGRPPTIWYGGGIPHLVVRGVSPPPGGKGGESPTWWPGKGVPHVAAKGEEVSHLVAREGGPPPCGKGGGLLLGGKGGVSHLVATEGIPHPLCDK